MRPNKTYRSLLLAIFLVFAVSVHTAAQGRSPLLDRIVASVRKANPKWHFIPDICTCPPLVPSQSSYAFGDWVRGKVNSRRQVSIYISYVSTSAGAAAWMADLGRRNLKTGWHREPYALADETDLLITDTGYAYLNFRNGSIVV